MNKNESKSNNTPRKADNNELKTDQLLSLMSIYLSEWEHRDEVLWRQVFKFYYAVLIVIIFPNITNSLKVRIPALSDRLFYIIGILMACMFLYVAIGTAMRTGASYEAYRKIANLLQDDKYKRVLVEKRYPKMGRLFSKSIAIPIIIAMFISLIVIAVILLIFPSK